MNQYFVGIAADKRIHFNTMYQLYNVVYKHAKLLKYNTFYGSLNWRSNNIKR